MKKLFTLLAIGMLLASGTPALATTTVAKTPVKKVVVVKKPVAKKVVKKKVVASTAKNPVFSPTAAALAMGNVPGGAAYQAALRKAEKDCIAAQGNKAKLAICEQEFLDAQLLLNQ